MRHDRFLLRKPVKEERTVELVEGLRLVASQGAPAQAQRAGEFLEALSRDDLGASGPAEALVEAFLHDPDLWR